MRNPIKTDDRTIAGRLRSFDEVDAAIQTQGGQAGARLNRKLGPQTAAAEPAVDYRLVLRDLGNELRAAREEMVAADTTHQGQLARVTGLGERRDALSQDLFSTFIRDRHTLENLYGSVRGFAVVGVAGPTLRDPMGLVKQVRQTVDFLENPKVELAAAEGFEVDLEVVAGRLSSGANELRGVLTGIARAKKRAETTRLAKNQAIDGYDRRFLHIARTVEGLFHLAEMKEAAERVRPSTRRPGRRAAEDSEPDEAASEAPATEGPPAEEAPSPPPTAGEPAEPAAGA